MTEKELPTIYGDVWEILKHQPKEIIDKLPKELLNKIDSKRDRKR